jgi:hypothetical protein
MAAADPEQLRRGVDDELGDATRKSEAARPEMGEASRQEE